MRDALLIHLDAAGGDCWWLATDHLGNGIGAPRRGPLTEAAAARGTRRSTVLLPTERCLVAQVRLPVRDPERAARALPALVEDRIAADVEDMHLVCGPIAGDGSALAVGVERSRLEAWLAALAAAGLDPDTLLPDALCLAADGGPQASLTGRRALLRWGARCAAIDPAALAMLAPSFFDGTDAAVLVLATPDADALAGQLTAALARAGIATRSEAVAESELARRLLRGARAALGYDLRRGAFARRASRSGALRAWRLPIALAALWATLAGLDLALEAGTLWRERRALDAELAALLPSVAPEAIGQPDPSIYLQRRLAGSAGGDGGASPLADVEAAMAAWRSGAGTELVAIDLRADRLELALRAPDHAALEAARAGVSAALGREVTIVGATSGAGHAEGRLVAPRRSTP
jgi:general secretion pathway protein L